MAATTAIPVWRWRPATEQFSQPFGPLAPGFVHVPFGDLDALEAAMDDDTAAVMFETIPATMGIVVPPEDFFAGVRQLCDQHGAVMIMDEVQTGLGRCGAVWGIDTYGVIPDILVTAKGLSGGIYPITATIYREPLDRFSVRTHSSTSPRSAAQRWAAMPHLKY